MESRMSDQVGVMEMAAEGEKEGKVEERGNEERKEGFFFFQEEKDMRYRSPSRGLGDVYKRQSQSRPSAIISPTNIRNGVKRKIRAITKTKLKDRRNPSPPSTI